MIKLGSADNLLSVTHYVFVLSGLFDQIIHSADNIDVVELFKHLHPKVSNSYVNSFIKLHLCIYKSLFCSSR